MSFNSWSYVLWGETSLRDVWEGMTKGIGTEEASSQVSPLTQTLMYTVGRELWPTGTNHNPTSRLTGSG